MNASLNPTAPGSIVPEALVQRRRAAKAEAAGTVAKQPKAKRPAKAAKKASKPKVDRTLERVPADEFRTIVSEAGLTAKEVAVAVGRSVSLVSGWMTEGGSGQVRNGRPTNPNLARARLAGVAKQVNAAGKAKAKADAKGRARVTAAAEARAEKAAKA